MNNWLVQSIQIANEIDYLDRLFEIYPTIPGERRIIDDYTWSKIKESFEKGNNLELIKSLLNLELFPIKDSYVAFLKRDKDSILRNPETINRLCDRVYEIGLNELFRICTEPKETNRQIGPMFKNWIANTEFNLERLDINEFLNTNKNAILIGSDDEMKSFARENLGYSHNKGLDFVARVNEKFVIGEAKFLTDFGGHQNAQFNDAISTIESPSNSDVIKVAILDGVVYIKSTGKMFRNITNEYKDYNIMSALVLKNFLNSL